jgi:hypothetical protein
VGLHSNEAERKRQVRLRQLWSHLHGSVYFCANIPAKSRALRLQLSFCEVATKSLRMCADVEPEDADFR